MGTGNKHLSFITELTKLPYKREYLSDLSLWQAVPDPRPDRDGDGPFITRDWIVTLNIICHWGDRQKLAVEGPFQFKTRLMTASNLDRLFIFWRFIDTNMQAWKIKTDPCVCVHSQLDYSLVLQTQADLSADHRRRINSGLWLQFFYVLLHERWKIKTCVITGKNSSKGCAVQLLI